MQQTVSTRETSYKVQLAVAEPGCDPPPANHAPDPSPWEGWCLPSRVTQALARPLSLSPTPLDDTLAAFRGLSRDSDGARNKHGPRQR